MDLRADVKISSMVVIPQTISLLIHTAPKTTIGSITVTYPQIETQLDSAPTEDDFDEDEQLYSAVDTQVLQRKYPSTAIPILLIDDSQTVAIIVPHFVNTIAERLVAKKIALISTAESQIMTFAPCQINNNLTISRLDMSPKWFQEVPLLQPPHVITGISAALISELSKTDFDFTRLGSLVLNAEGQPGFEKIDADAMMDAADQSANFLVGVKYKDEFLNQLSLTVRKVNSAVTSGMYL